MQQFKISLLYTVRKKILLLIFTIFLLSFHLSSFAGKVLVENVFSDISADYKYRDELQELYDRGMILPDIGGKFEPEAYLNRDEFVGISMEVICERCIQPHTEFKFIEAYANEDVYFDIDNTNPYFYCVAEADARSYVRGYDIGESCQNGTNKFDERPFCPLNRINLEEAVAVLLRNSGIFTIADNQRVISDIWSGRITENIANDVAPTDFEGNPYTFYGYIKKALAYSITVFDEEGNEKVLHLLETDSKGNVYPDKSITKEEFLRMSFIALKSNSCSDVVDNNLAIAIDIWEKSCSPDDVGIDGEVDCEISDVNDPTDIYDFTPDVEGYCEAGIENPTGYSWRFYNTTNGQEFFHYGTFLDDILLPSVGEWKVYLTVRDKCGNTGQVYSTIVVNDVIPEEETEIEVDIEVYEGVCADGGEDCDEEERIYPNCEGVGCTPEVVCEDNYGCHPILPPDVCDDEEECDYTVEVETTCEAGIDESSYTWRFTNTDTGEVVRRSGEYINNYSFLSEGRWLVHVDVEDNCGNRGSDDVYVHVSTIEIEIEVYEGVCADGGEDCDEEERIYPDCEGVGCIPEVVCEENYGCHPVLPPEECEQGEECDYTVKVETTCEAGIDETSYTWKFTNTDTGEVIRREGEYINDFSFLTQGRWLVHVEVRDNCGNRGEDDVYVDIGKVTNELALNVDILVEPIIGYEPLLVDFEGVVTGGVPPYSYAWDFRDGNTGVGKYIDNIFLSKGIYEVLLIGTDTSGLSGDATVLIKVLEQVCDPNGDMDGDGISDCDDFCPTIPGTNINQGCPVFETECGEDCSCPSGYTCSDPDPLTCSAGVCLPIEINPSCLYDANVGSIFGNTMCNTCPCNSSVDFLADIRRCDLVFPAITSPDAKNIYSRGKIWEVR